MSQKLPQNSDRNSDSDSDPQSRHGSYWRANLIVIGILMGIWFFVGYVISIFSIEWFNTFKIAKLGVGFWFAQQGSIITFVLLVLVYALVMDRLDRHYGQGESK